jgi:hypothetical protein
MEEQRRTDAQPVPRPWRAQARSAEHDAGAGRERRADARRDRGWAPDLGEGDLAGFRRSEAV